MPELNGKTYEMQYLTDEETAVINAMRRGAKVQANFFHSNEKAASAHLDELSLETFPRLDSYEIDGGYDVQRFESDNVQLVHFIKK